MKKISDVMAAARKLANLAEIMYPYFRVECDSPQE